jgi:hypothetical protein
VQRHIARLVDLRIIKKVTIWLKGRWCEMNTYTFCLAWKAPPAQRSPMDKTMPNLPHTKTVPNTQAGNTGKEGSLTEEIATLEKSIHLYCSPGSIAYVSTLERIEVLRAMLQP